VSLGDAIEAQKKREQIAAFEKAEAELAATLPDTPRPLIDPETKSRLEAFLHWCNEKNVRFCPARPTTVAAYVRFQAALGVSEDKILAGLAAVEALHHYHGLASPTQSPALDAALDEVLTTVPPRSWNADEKVLFAQLPPTIRKVIARREEDRERWFRRQQNETATKRQLDGAEKSITTTKEVRRDSQTQRQ
jgi:hypothetical protein